MSGAQTTSGSTKSATNTEATVPFVLSQEQNDYVVKYGLQCQTMLHSQYTLRSEFEEIDRQYQREKDWTEGQIKSRIANRRGDSSKIQDVTVPIIFPQVNSALSYMTEVFTSGYPIFPVVSDPLNENTAMMLEAIVQENATTSGWSAELIKFFRDGLKYNIAAVEIEWRQKTNWTIQNDIKATSGGSAKKVLWNGNTMKRMDLYNTFWDPRVPISKIHEEGEFVGYTELFSRVRFKKFINELYNKVPVDTILRAINSEPIQATSGSTVASPYGVYVPFINPYPLYNKSGTFDWMAWATNTTNFKNAIQYKNAYAVTRLYGRIIPSDFGLKVPEKNTPQVWKFIIINGSVVLASERLTNIHNYIPILFSQMYDDGLDYQTKSFAQNVTDMQYIASSLMNGYIASKRRLVGDRVLYDPSRVAEKDINSQSPVAKIPVRPSAFGKPVGEAVFPFPYRDEGSDMLVQGTTAVVNMANLINGQNPATQGQFVKGNKTRHEYDDIMGHGNAQNKLIAVQLETSFFTPAKEIIKLNILQYQESKDIYNDKTQKTVSVKPEDLRKDAVKFKVCDGLIPSDKITGDDMLQVAMQQMGTSPQIASQYNLGDAFSYLMKTQGVDLTPFQKSPAQIQYEQQMQTWQQMAQAAIQKGADFNTPMPQPSPQLQQEMQQRQQTGGAISPDVRTAAIQSTQGG